MLAMRIWWKRSPPGPGIGFGIGFGMDFGMDFGRGFEMKFGTKFGMGSGMDFGTWLGGEYRYLADGQSESMESCWRISKSE